ncbi:helix-turn-helix domain containing protein [Aliarcobacter cryaerophilus]|jgi:transcriptional regulator with XRE-family HTH domain|uniref:helix-turn-helix domain containing protein n=1 Tax=Aliarcobacter cryaerophilus TaxID=28198 RepID=UPI0021B3E0BB|nr:helix-turn-helix domain containing protein [Aliarcobacter cryaerophilus]MCT7506127.1 helix-turn-helix domain containing protein [Aliarcobacter cryaerophilus]
MNVKITTEKMKIAMNATSYLELAKQLNITLPTIDSWKKRNTIPNKYLLKVSEDTGVSIDWLLDEDKPTFHISGGSKNISQVNGGIINQGSVIEKEFELFDENDPVFISFKKAYECVKNEKNKLNELEDLLEDFYRKYR